MPVSEQPLVERIARVLAGAAHSSNAEGSDPSAGDKIDLVWREHVNQALAVLHTMREPDRTNGRGRRRRNLGEDGRNGDRVGRSRWRRPPDARSAAERTRKSAKSYQASAMADAAAATCWTATATPEPPHSRRDDAAVRLAPVVHASPRRSAVSTRTAARHA